MNKKVLGNLLVLALSLSGCNIGPGGLSPIHIIHFINYKAFYDENVVMAKTTNSKMDYLFEINIENQRIAQYITVGSCYKHKNQHREDEYCDYLISRDSISRITTNDLGYTIILLIYLFDNENYKSLSWKENNVYQHNTLLHVFSSFREFAIKNELEEDIFLVQYDFYTEDEIIEKTIGLLIDNYLDSKSPESI